MKIRIIGNFIDDSRVFFIFHKFSIALVAEGYLRILFICLVGSQIPKNHSSFHLQLPFAVAFIDI